jgi:hypothetical protein
MYFEMDIDELNKTLKGTGIKVLYAPTQEFIDVMSRIYDTCFKEISENKYIKSILPFETTPVKCSKGTKRDFIDLFWDNIYQHQMDEVISEKEKQLHVAGDSDYEPDNEDYNSDAEDNPYIEHEKHCVFCGHVDKVNENEHCKP